MTDRMWCGDIMTEKTRPNETSSPLVPLKLSLRTIEDDAGHRGKKINIRQEIIVSGPNTV